jgi:hypothetical protein
MANPLEVVWSAMKDGASLLWEPVGERGIMFQPLETQ